MHLSNIQLIGLNSDRRGVLIGRDSPLRYHETIMQTGLQTINTQHETRRDEVNELNDDYIRLAMISSAFFP